MDRKRQDELPKMQLGFIDAVCQPVYKVTYDLLEHFFFIILDMRILT